MAKMSGQVAVVFGGMGGIGQACCVHLLKAGAKVLCADIEEHEDVIITWCEHHGNDRLRFKKCDVTQESEIIDCFEHCQEEFYRAPHIVVNAATIIDEFSWSKCINVNLSGSVRIASACMEKMGRDKDGEGGVLILFSSVLGLSPGPNVPVYTAVAHAIIGYVRSMAHDLQYSDHGIRINAICPTVVDTPLLDNSLNGKMHKPDVMAKVLESIGGKKSIFAATTIAGEVMKVISNPETNGQVVLISKINGVQHIIFEEQPHL